MQKYKIFVILCIFINLIASRCLIGSPSSYLESSLNSQDPIIKYYKTHIQNRNNDFIVSSDTQSEDLLFLNVITSRSENSYEEYFNKEEYLRKLKIFYSALKYDLQNHIITLLPDSNKWNIYMNSAAFISGLGIGIAGILSGDIEPGLILMMVSCGVGKLVLNDYKNVKGSLIPFAIYPKMNSTLLKISPLVLRGKIHEIALGATIGYSEHIKNYPLADLNSEILNLKTFLMGQFNQKFTENHNFSLNVLKTLKLDRL